MNVWWFRVAQLAVVPSSKRSTALSHARELPPRRREVTIVVCLGAGSDPTPVYSEKPAGRKVLPAVVATISCSSCGVRGGTHGAERSQLSESAGGSCRGAALASWRVRSSQTVGMPGSVVGLSQASAVY